MDSYYTIRLELKELNAKNQKLEYRALYSELKKEGFTETFLANENEFILPDGMYAILKYNFSQHLVLQKAEEALELALKPYYGAAWIDKYDLTVSGAGVILSRNLDQVKKNFNSSSLP
jgi:hypothetical protein